MWLLWKLLMQLHSLYFSQLRDFCDDSVQFVCGCGGVGGDSDAAKKKKADEKLFGFFQVLGTIKMSTSNHRRHPNTFHFCPGFLTSALTQVCIASSEIPAVVKMNTTSNCYWVWASSSRLSALEKHLPFWTWVNRVVSSSSRRRESSTWPYGWKFIGAYGWKKVWKHLEIH